MKFEVHRGCSLYIEHIQPMMRKASSRLQRMAEEQMKQRGYQSREHHRKPEGTVTVEKTRTKKDTKRTSSSDDDYVDFVEIK